MKLIRLDVTTDTAGDGTFLGDAIPGGGVAVHCLEYFPGTIDTGATVTVTDEFNGASFTVWTKASAGTSNIRKFPRILEALNSDGSDLTSHTFPVICGRPKVTIADGGSVAAGYVILHVMEL